MGPLVLNKKHCCQRFIHGGIVKKNIYFWSMLLGMLVPNKLIVARAAEAQQPYESQECSQVIKQLQMMSLAQKSLLDSMLKKNELLASTLDHYASDFESRGQKIKRGDLASLRNSAKAFRKHEIREQALVEKFETQAEKLIAKANTCLDDSFKPSELRQSSDIHSSR